jgi:hypothetical protein
MTICHPFARFIRSLVCAAAEASDAPILTRCAQQSARVLARSLFHYNRSPTLGGETIESKNNRLLRAGSGRIGTLRARLAAKHPAVNSPPPTSIRPDAKKLAEKAGADFIRAAMTKSLRARSYRRHCSDAERRTRCTGAQALSLGKPVLVEKPIARTLNDADAILAELRQAVAICTSVTAGATRNVSCAPRSKSIRAASARSSAARRASTTSAPRHSTFLSAIRMPRPCWTCSPITSI